MKKLMRDRQTLIREIMKQCTAYLDFTESVGNEDAWCDSRISTIKELATMLPELGEE